MYIFLKDFNLITHLKLKVLKIGNIKNLDIYILDILNELYILKEFLNRFQY
jgi:hypothetical protein